MRAGATIRFALLGTALMGMLWPAASVRAQQANEPVVLDRVVAVVNNHAILESDLDAAMRLSALEPPEGANAKPDRKSALDELISRELIEEQMTPEEKNAAAPGAKVLKERLTQMREDLPACVRYHCATDKGWAAFLDANRLTDNEAKKYLGLRLSLLSFIENRFRQGIRISQEEIENYYRDTLVPQYASGQAAPPLASVSPRIEEVLLQQQVNQLFGAWLDNLRKQGDVEILDLAPAGENQPGQTGGER